jgi:hypothetical protein
MAPVWDMMEWSIRAEIGHYNANMKVSKRGLIFAYYWEIRVFNASFLIDGEGIRTICSEPGSGQEQELPGHPFGHDRTMIP